MIIEFVLAGETPTPAAGISAFYDERQPIRYATKEKIAPPKHIPMPVRRTISTARRFAQAEPLVKAKRLKAPKAISTKHTHRKLR